ncbi:GNAT family N-acetyltransferase [Eggerthia catenaformis]
MKIIRADYTHLQEINNLFNQAKHYFYLHHIDQWQDGYPDIELLQQDIDSQSGYVLLDYTKVIGYMFFAIYDEPSYRVIKKGHWLTDQKYGVIHRIVIDNTKKGQSLAAMLLNYAENDLKSKNISSIRIDTHKNNLSMQNFLVKHHFQYCGDINLSDGSPRIAFEKILS